MDRNRAALRQGRAVEAEQARRGVEPLLDDRRERAAQQRRLHLAGNAVELVAGDVDDDRIEFGCGWHGIRGDIRHAILFAGTVSRILRLPQYWRGSAAALA